MGDLPEVDVILSVCGETGICCSFHSAPQAFCPNVFRDRLLAITADARRTLRTLMLGAQYFHMSYMPVLCQVLEVVYETFPSMERIESYIYVSDDRPIEDALASCPALPPFPESLRELTLSMVTANLMRLLTRCGDFGPSKLFKLELIFNAFHFQPQREPAQWSAAHLGLVERIWTQSARPPLHYAVAGKPDHGIYNRSLARIVSASHAVTIFDMMREPTDWSQLRNNPAPNLRTITFRPGWHEGSAPGILTMEGLLDAITHKQRVCGELPPHEFTLRIVTDRPPLLEYLLGRIEEPDAFEFANLMVSRRYKVTKELARAVERINARRELLNRDWCAWDVVRQQIGRAQERRVGNLPRVSGRMPSPEGDGIRRIVRARRANDDSQPLSSCLLLACPMSVLRRIQRFAGRDGVLRSEVHAEAPEDENCL